MYYIRHIFTKFATNRMHNCFRPKQSQRVNSAVCINSFFHNVDVRLSSSTSSLREEFTDYLTFLKSLLNDKVTHESMSNVSHFPKMLLGELGGPNRNSHQKLREIVKSSESLFEKQSDLNELEAFSKTEDLDTHLMNELKSEMELLKEDISERFLSITNLMIQDQELEKCEGAILEILPGVGGAEAMLFARELFEMYQQFCERNNLNWQVVGFQLHDRGGIYNASALVTPIDAFKYLRYEAGTHRVQRVPETGKGQVHTSTATVAILPQQTQILEAIPQKDLDISYSRSSGPGGQSVNTTDSAVQVNHKPSGIKVRCEVTRNQRENLRLALIEITQKVHNKLQSAKLAKDTSVRSMQIKRRDRSDKIRTYNFMQDRVTDHRIGYTIHGLQNVLTGGPQLFDLINALDENYVNETKMAVLAGLLDEYRNTVKMAPVVKS